MAVHCSLEPYRLNQENELKASELFRTVIKTDVNTLESAIDALTEKCILPTIEEFMNLRGYDMKELTSEMIPKLKRRILAMFLYSEADARTPKGATGYPVYSSGELTIASTLAALSTDEMYSEDVRSEFTKLATKLGIDVTTAFNPNIINTASFSELDYNNIARLLTAVYFRLKNINRAQRTERFGKDFNELSNTGFKSLIFAELKAELAEYKANPKFKSTRFQDMFVANVLNDLHSGNSEIFKYFLDYLNKNYGINRKNYSRSNIEINDESTEEGQRDNIEDIDVMWDEMQKERIDRKNTLSSRVKAQIAQMTNTASFGNRTSNKMYLPIPIDINILWNKLIEAHLYDITPTDYYNRIKQLASISNDFTPILEVFQRVFENDGVTASEEDKSFVNAYISGVGLSVIPVNIMALDSNNASIYQNNRNSFATKIYIDRFESVIDTNIEFGLYKDFRSTLYTNTKSKYIFSPIGESTKINHNELINKQMQVINYLGLAITRDALNQYYEANQYKNDAYANVNNLLQEVAYDIERRIENYKGGNIPANNVNGYLYSLAEIASYDFNNLTNMSYLDVQGKLNYSPQYDSMLTKFLRGFVTRTGVNTEYINQVFKDYLNDPTLTVPGAEDNLLIYDEKTGLGIFEKNAVGEYVISQHFLKDVEQRKQFALAAFNGIKIGNKGYKYREVQGALYTYTEVILNMLGQYVFLTSDSPRSYMMSTKRIGVEDLFVKDESKTRTPVQVKTFGTNYSVDAVKRNQNAIFIFSGDTRSRLLGQPAANGQASVRGLANTIEIDGYKADEVANGKPVKVINYTDEDYDAYVEDFQKRVIPFINQAIKEGKNIYLPKNGISKRLANNAPRIYAYVNNYLEELAERNKFTRITDNPINQEAAIFHAIEKIVNSDVAKFDTFGRIIFQLRDNSDENLAKMRTRHNVKYWNGKAIYDKNGIPTGRAFAFANITYVENGKNITLPQHIAKMNGISVEEVYKNMIAKARNEAYNSNFVPNVANIKDFVTAYIRWNASTVVDSFSNIINNVYNTSLKDADNVTTTFDSYLSDLIQEVYTQKANDWVSTQNKKGKTYTLDTIPAGRRENLYYAARQHILDNIDILDNDGVRLGMLKILLNHTVYNHSINTIFNGDVEEYKNTVDLNKRVSQVIKNGLNSINAIEEPTPRKILVMADMNFDSNIWEKMGVTNPKILDAYKKAATVNDSQSIMTDVALVKLLKATGRWNVNDPICQYILDLQDPTKTFDPTKYAKVVEQVKLFGTARRRRGEFYHNSAVEEGQEDIFANEVDSVQIKDSTVVIFEATTRGTAMGDLYDWMVKNEVDQISPISAVKVSGITPAIIHTADGKLDIDALNALDDTSMLYMQDKDFVIQQDIKADLLDEVTVLGSQLIKQIMEGLDWNNAIYQLGNKKLTGNQLFNEFQKTLATNVREDAMCMLYEIGGIDENGELRTDAKGNIQIDINKLVNKFQEIIADDVDAITIRQALKIGPDGLPTMPLSYPILRGKLEKILASMLSKQVINKYMPGFHAPIRADIFTASNALINHKKLYSDKELYNKTIDELVANGSITYSSDFVERCKKTGRSLELQAEYRDEDGYYHAEVIVNPWSMDFYKNIGTTKTITNADGTTKDIITVDIDKIDAKARQMIGIRIPTEGKQSMVVFEVVGFLNNNATQAIFPQSLVTRTGWDFDIDSIYAYCRNVTFEEGRYIPVEFNENVDTTQGTIGGNFERSIFKSKYREIMATPQDFTNLTSPIFPKIVKWIYQNYTPSVRPNAAKQSYLHNIMQLIEQDLNDVKSNQEYRKVLKTLRHNLKYGFNKNLTTAFNLVGEYLISRDKGQTNLQGNYTQTQNAYAQDLLINAYKAVNDLIKFVKTTRDQLVALSVDGINNFDTIKDNFNYVVEDTEKLIAPALSQLERNFDKAFKAFTANYAKTKNNYELNSREARENHLLDIIESILSNPAHTNEVNKPNDFVELKEVSDRENALWNYTLATLNPNNLLDKITLNNMSMASTVLKGHSVNFDTCVATLSTLHGRLMSGIRRKVSLKSLPIPTGFTSREEMYTVNSKGVPELTSKYKEFLINRFGDKNFELLAKDNALWINDVCINNDNENQHLDISGERVETQMNQFTTGILDSVKAGLGFNLNVHTLTVARTMSMGVTIEEYNGSTNRFSNCDAFIHQPAIVEAVNRTEVRSLSNGRYTINDAINEVRDEYSVEVAKMYSDAVMKHEITPVKSHNEIMAVASNIGKTKRLNIAQLNEIKEAFPNVTITEISGKYGYQTTEELLDNIKNRNERTVDWYLRQISVLNNFAEYNEIATSLVDLNFMLKSESRVDNFFKADQKERKLAEYYYPIRTLKSKVNDKYNATLKFINDYIAENAGNPQEIDAIKASFARDTSAEFRRKFAPKDVEGNPLAAITYADLKLFRTEFPMRNDITSRKELIDTLNIGYQTPTKVVLDDGRDVVESIFTGSFDGYLDGNKFRNTEDSSAYSVIQARYQYGHWLMANGFGDVFITRHTNVQNAILGNILAHKGYIDESTYKYVCDNIMNYLVSMYGAINNGQVATMPILTPENTPEILNILGVHTDNQLKEQKTIFKRLMGTVKDGFTAESFADYTKLSLAQQIRFIQNEPTLKSYIEQSPEFRGNNVFKYLTQQKNTRNKPYDVIRIIRDENDVNSTSDMTDSILRMWDSNIPYIAHTVRQLLMYTYVTEGFNYAYNISKYIPIDLLTTNRPNSQYDGLCRKIHYVDPSVNIGSYADTLRNVEKAVFDGTIDISSVMGMIARTKSDMNPILLNDSQKAFRWETNKNKATIGFVLDSEGNNVGVSSYIDEHGREQRFFIETEARLINSEYGNSEYVTERGPYGINKVYKRYEVPTETKNPLKKVYVFLPVNPILRNESALMQDDISIIPGYQDGMSTQVDNNGTPIVVDRMEAIIHSDAINRFMNAIDELGNGQMDEISDSNDANLMETEDAQDSTTDVNNEDVTDEDISAVSTDDNDVLNSLVIPTPNISNLQNSYFPISDVALKEIENSATALYITNPTTKSFIKGFHRNAIQVDYTKSSYEEALRVASMMKNGNLYINGDDVENSTKSYSYLNDWTKTFLANLYTINPVMTSISTIVNAGVGRAVAESYVDVPRRNINIYGTEDMLYSRIIKAETPSDNPIRNTFIIDSDIAIQTLKTMNRMETYLNRRNAGNRDTFTNILRSFDEESFDGGIQAALAERDIDAIKATYKRLTNLSSAIYDTINQLWAITKGLNYAEIRDNYGAALDYKDRLVMITELATHFQQYANLQEIKQEDTLYAGDDPALKEAFIKEYGELNANIAQLKDLANKVNELHGSVIQAIKDVITWNIIDKSRNPKFATEFSKIKEYLASHNYTLDGFNINDVNITEEEWLEIQHILFTLDKDITRTQAMLDSAFTTGVSLLDITGKAWDESNYKAKRAQRRINDELEAALEEFQPGLSKNARARERLMHKFINEYGDLIGSYRTEGLGDSTKTLRDDIKDIINTTLYTDTGFITRDTADATLKAIDKAIEDYNSSHTWKLVRLSDEEANKHLAEMTDLSNREKRVYIQTHNLVDLDIITDVTGKRENVLYKIDFAETPVSDEYAALSEKEKKLLNTIRSLIQRTIKDYDSNWINYAGRWDEVMPFIPKATMLQSIKGFISLPTLHQDSYYIDVNGNKRYMPKATTLQIPNYIPKFKIRNKYASETWDSFEKNVLDEFNAWFDKNNKLEGVSRPTTIKEIRHYNDEVLKQNKRYKAQVMSYDIVDVMKGFTQELYNIRAINNFEVDYQLTKHLLDTPTNTGETPRAIIKNASKQFEAMERRVLNLSKYSSAMDIAAGGLLRFTSMSFMYLNYTAGITNVLKGVTDMIIESAADSFVESKDILRAGLKDIIKTVPKFLRDINNTRTDNLLVAIIKDFDDIYQDTRDVTSSDTATSYWVKAMRMVDTVGYAPNNMGEFIMQFGMLLAATNSHRVVGSKIMSFNDFFNDNLEGLLHEVLSVEQYDKYLQFKEKKDADIKKWERKYGKEYLWSHDYAAEFLKTNYALLDSEQRKKIVDSRKTDKKVQREAFEKFNTLRSQLKLEDGRLSYNEDSGITEEALSEFRSRVKAINQSLHGIYNRVDRNSLQDYAVGDLLMQFRKWIRPNFNRMFGRRIGRIFYNEQLGSFEVPIMNSFYDMFRSGSNAFKDTLKDDNTVIDYAKASVNFLRGIGRWLTHIGFYYKTLPLNEQIAARKLARYMGSLAFSILAVIAVGAFKGRDDDDDDEDNILFMHAMYTATSYYQQMVEMFPVYGQLAMLKQTTQSIFAGQKTVVNAAKLINLLSQSLWVDNEEFIYDRGIYKGQDKRAVVIKQLIPILRQMNKYNHLGSMVSYYNMYNPFDMSIGTLRKLINSGYDNSDED